MQTSKQFDDLALSGLRFFMKFYRRNLFYRSFERLIRPARIFSLAETTV